MTKFTFKIKIFGQEKEYSSINNCKAATGLGSDAIKARWYDVRKVSARNDIVIATGEEKVSVVKESKKKADEEKIRQRRERIRLGISKHKFDKRLSILNSDQSYYDDLLPA